MAAGLEADGDEGSDLGPVLGGGSGGGLVAATGGFPLAMLVAVTGRGGGTVCATTFVPGWAGEDSGRLAMAGRVAFGAACFFCLADQSQEPMPTLNTASSQRNLQRERWREADKRNWARCGTAGFSQNERRNSSPSSIISEPVPGPDRAESKDSRVNPWARVQAGTGLWEFVTRLKCLQTITVGTVLVDLVGVIWAVRGGVV